MLAAKELGAGVTAFGAFVGAALAISAIAGIIHDRDHWRSQALAPHHTPAVSAPAAHSPAAAPAKAPPVSPQPASPSSPTAVLTVIQAAAYRRSSSAVAASRTLAGYTPPARTSQATPAAPPPRTHSPSRSPVAAAVTVRIPHAVASATVHP